MKDVLRGESSAFIAAAHELKAPLLLINHLARAMADADLHLSAAEKRQHIERLRLTTERMLRLTQHLTLSYRLDNDDQLRFAFVTEPLSVSEVCMQVLHEMTPYAKEHRQELRLNSHRCPHMVIANRDILHDIVLNLVDNALRHNPEGAVVEVSSHCRQAMVRLRVRDNGPGMLPSELNQLRQRLGRELQPLNGRSGTSGLGLYIVNQLAGAMGGSIGLGRGEGTTLFVDLLRSRQLSLL